MSNDGATPEVAQNQNDPCPGDGSGRVFKHNWVWVWEGSVWTDKIRCTTCNEVRNSKKVGDSQ